jgi:hypothetical protein
MDIMDGIRIVDSIRFLETNPAFREKFLDASSFFYKGNVESLTLSIQDCERMADGRLGKKRSTLRGSFEHQTQKINLYVETIRQHFGKKLHCGGNFPCASYEASVLSVFVHEVQHANQALIHTNANERFWRGRSYLGRPCEVDARRFVDENRQLITEILGGQLEADASEDNEDREQMLGHFLEFFMEFEEVPLEEIRSQLRSSKMNNPVYIGRLLEGLAAEGVIVSR